MAGLEADSRAEITPESVVVRSKRKGSTVLDPMAEIRHCPHSFVSWRGRPEGPMLARVVANKIKADQAARAPRTPSSGPGNGNALNRFRGVSNKVKFVNRLGPAKPHSSDDHRLKQAEPASELAEPAASKHEPQSAPPSELAEPNTAPPTQTKSGLASAADILAAIASRYADSLLERFRDKFPRFSSAVVSPAVHTAAGSLAATAEAYAILEERCVLDGY